MLFRSFAYHTLVKKVTLDFENLQMNTAISQMMIFINEAYKALSIYRPYLKGFIQLFSCVAPHLGEELWSHLGFEGTLAFSPWPTYDETKLIQSMLSIAVSLNGKFKVAVDVENGLSDEAVQTVLLAKPEVQKYLEGKTIKKVIVVKNKLVNFIVI